MRNVIVLSTRISCYCVMVALLGALFVPAAWGEVSIANSGFETPVFSTNSHNYKDPTDPNLNITGTGWTHTGRSGIDNGNPFGGSAPNCAPYEGVQMAFLQGDDGYHNGVTSLGQDLSGFTVGESYSLSFYAMGISGYSGVNPFNVSIGGTDLFGLLSPGTTYEYYTSAPFVATAETMSLLFYDQGDAPSGQVTFIDAIDIIEPEAINLVANGSFEDPAYANPSHNYADGIDGSGWTPTGRAGIDHGNAYGSVTNSVAADGVQMAFLQGDANNVYTPAPDGVTSLTQTIEGLVAGQTYELSFKAQGIAGFSGANPFYVSMGGSDLFGLITPTTEYNEYSTSFVATSDTMDLRFYDQGNITGAMVSQIDSVAITPTAVPEPGLVSLLITSVIAAFAFGTRRRKA